LDISVRIGTSDNVKYAAIQEFGGTIAPHEIVPDKAKALAFAVGGKQVFAARVNLPAVTMPERSYLRSSLGEMAGEISSESSARRWSRPSDEVQFDLTVSAFLSAFANTERRRSHAHVARIARVFAFGHRG
jgi:hypothetical protein